MLRLRQLLLRLAVAAMGAVAAKVSNVVADAGWRSGTGRIPVTKPSHNSADTQGVTTAL